MALVSLLTLVDVYLVSAVQPAVYHAQKESGERIVIKIALVRTMQLVTLSVDCVSVPKVL